MPLLLALFYHFNLIENKNSNLIKYFFYLIITYCFYRILRFEIFYIFIYFSILIFIFYKKYISLKYLVIIYLFITTCFYFEKYVKIRGWDDLRKNDMSQSFNAEIIDNKLKYLKWKTVYFKNIDSEKKLIFATLNYLKNLDDDVNYILISDYQIYNLILNKKDFSPVKYWHKNATYPSKNHKLRKNFEIFFKNKILQNNVSQIIIDNTAGFKTNELVEFEWLYSCLENKSFSDEKSLNIFFIKNNCLI